MKIGQIPHLYLPHQGGIEYYVYRLKTSLEARGHEVTVYTTDLSIRGTKKREKNTFYYKTDFVLMRNPFSSELSRKIKETRDDIYHLHCPWFFPSLLATEALEGRPKIMTSHSVEIGGGELATAMLDKIYRPFARRILRKMDMVIVSTGPEKKVLLRLYGLPSEKVVLIPNAIKIEEFAPKKMAIEKFVRKYHLKEDSFKVLFVSRFIPQKNPDKLISAVTKHMKGKNVEVILIGGGPPSYVAKLREMSDERIHIIGEVKFEELVAAYHSSDLFVFLGTWEGIPTVILEAMICGLPVIATPVGGIPGVVVGKEHGLFIEHPISEEDLADKISHFMNMGKADYTKISKANVRRIETHFNWEPLVDKIVDVYNQVLER